MIEKLKWGAVIAVSMVLGGAVVVGVNSLSSDDPPVTTVIERVIPSSNNGASNNTTSGGVSNSTATTVADLYEEVRPSIVRINAGMGMVSSGLGSGIVIDKEGHILTNNHVVSSFSAIDVVLWDGTAAPAEVVGRDPGNDLAVIKIDVDPDLLVPARLGDSDSVRVGEFVIAVGNPFDLEGSVTEGIVSGIGRTLSSGGGRPLRQLIQADAAINPGNSGGALFNGRGEVIGITTAIENPSGERVFVGIGYAVPVNAAKRFLPQMLDGLDVQHPRLGVELRDLTPSMAQSMGLPVERGVVIWAVGPGTAAERAGLRGGVGATGNPTGDVIVAIDGEEIRNFEDLARYIDSRSVGDTVEVRFYRGSEEMTLEVVLEAWRSG